MAWGRIEDEFDEHDKINALLDEYGNVDGAGALGLWLLCFTWANRNTRRTRSKKVTPGRLRRSLPREKLGADGVRFAAMLVAHELWDAVPEEEGGGWQIHNFAAYLPGAGQSEKKAEAGRKGGLAKQENRRQQAAITAMLAGASTPASTGEDVSGSTSLPASGDVLPVGGSQAPGGSTSPVLLASTTGVPPVLDVSQQGAQGVSGSTEAQPGSKVLHIAPGAGTSTDAADTPDDLREPGELHSIDGTIPGLGSTVLPGRSENAPHSHTQSLQKTKTLAARAAIDAEFDQHIWPPWAGMNPGERSRGDKQEARNAWRTFRAKDATTPTSVVVAGFVPVWNAATSDQFVPHLVRVLKRKLWRAPFDPAVRDRTRDGNLTPGQAKPGHRPFENPRDASVYDVMPGTEAREKEAARRAAESGEPGAGWSSLSARQFA